MKIGSKIKLIGGGTPNKEIEEYWGGNIPWVSVKDLKSDYITSTIDKITDLGVKNSVAKIVKKGTLLISTRMAVGKTAIAGVDLAFNQDIKAIQHNEEIDTKFLLYFLKSKQTYFESISSGATVKGIKIQDILNIQIPLPPLDVQKRIATLLDTADSLRQKDKALLQKYDALAQSLFLELFGDPVRNEKGWEFKTIEGITKKGKSSIKRGPFGGALKKEIFVSEGYLVYEQFHALNNDFSMARYFIDEKKFQELKGFEVQPGDIIISCSGVYLGKLAVIPKDAKKGIINQALLKVTLDEQIMRNDFFTFQFTQKSFKETYFDSNRGAGVPNFPPMSDFKKFKFICPPISLQNQFAEQIQLIEKQKVLVQENLAKSEALFMGLLAESFG